MNGAHDLGGTHGLGPVGAEPESVEPVFHHAWERRAFALTLACGFLGQWNIDESRHARERQHPVNYLRNSYYENWMAGLSRLLVEKGLVTAEELDRGRSSSLAELEPVRADGVEALLRRGGPVDLPAHGEARFAVGDTVRANHDHPAGHTRVPRYVRGRTGTVAEHHGCHVFADANAHGQRRGEHLYSVRFEASSLWGRSAGGRDAVYVDLWEPHLERA